LIADLLHEADLLAALRGCLKSIRDLERAAGRLSQASGNARDLVALKISLLQIPELKSELRKLIERVDFGKEQPQMGTLCRGVFESLHEMPGLTERLSTAVVDDPPLVLKEGGIFRDGFDADLDELRQGSREGKNWIAQLQEREIAGGFFVARHGAELLRCVFDMIHIDCLDHQVISL